MTTLCDACPAPGSCCKDLHLSGGGGYGDNFENLCMSRAWAEDMIDRHQLPFTVGRSATSYDYWTGEINGWLWRFNCPKVTPEGRCSIYESRPALCASYEAASDDLCVFGPGRIHGATIGKPHHRDALCL